MANSKKAPVMKLSRKEDLPGPGQGSASPRGDKLVANPNKTWKDVNSSLPATKIEVLGPPPTSGTRDAFTEMVPGLRAAPPFPSSRT